MWIPGSRRFRTSLRVIKSPAQSQFQLYHQAIVCHISSGLGRHKKAPSQNNLNNNYINVSAAKSVLMSARIFSAKPQIDNRSNYVNWATVSVVDRAGNEGSRSKISQSWRRPLPLLRPYPGWKRLLTSCSTFKALVRHYGKRSSPWLWNLSEPSLPALLETQDPDTLLNAASDGSDHLTIDSRDPPPSCLLRTFTASSRIHI